eukprot:162377_1
MMDPMANLTTPGGQQQPGQAGTAPGEDSMEVFDMHAQMQNMQKMESIRSFMGIVSGCCAGILGLTDIRGIAFFVAMHLLVNGCLLGRVGGNIDKYRKGTGKVGFIMEGAQSSFMSFMLFWTLFYGLVYLF